MMMHQMHTLKWLSMLFGSLGIGYLVYSRAKDEKGLMKQLGYVIGVILILVSLIMALQGLCMKTCYKMPGLYGV